MIAHQPDMQRKQKAIRTPAMIAGIIIVALTALLFGAWPALSEAPAADVDLAAVLPQTITYQGRLTDNAGVPLTGSYTMRFILYDDAVTGSLLFDSGNQSVSVTDGLFTVALNTLQSAYDGRALWLSIRVEGQTLSPRQPIYAAPYAMSLRPGSLIRQEATGAAVRAESIQGVGLRGTGRVTGVHGVSSSTTQGAGYGVHGESSTGIGVYGHSTAQTTVNNQFAPGVSGFSQHGVGVLGQAATGFAIYGTSPGVGVGGVGRAYGVYGASASTTQGTGYGGYFTSITGIGVSGRSTALSSAQNMLAPGVYGYSQHGAGVVGQSGVGIGVYVIGNLIATGSKAGYIVDIARNDGDEPLQQGDLVVVTGVTEPVVGTIPVPLVRKADSAASRAIIGVVDELYQPHGSDVGMFSTGLINPGDYLTIVTLGAYMSINVDAGYGAIHPGDLLVSSPTPGYAMRAEEPAIGTVIGKALSSLESGRGSIAIMVTMQ